MIMSREPLASVSYTHLSDQVWNPDVFRPSFFLSFANEEKKKISYAASIGNSITGKEMQSEYEDALNKFDRISVREKSDINKLEDLCKKRVEWVVDPVFLLTEKQWETCLLYTSRVKCHLT